MNQQDRPLPILLVDDEEEILFSTGMMLRTEGFPNVLTESDSRKVMGILERQEVSLVILDLNMPRPSGHELLKEIGIKFPRLPVIVMTALNELEMAVECMKVGALDYFVKPAEKERILASVRKGLALNPSTHGAAEGPLSPAFAPIVTCSPKMKSIFQYLSAVAGTDQPVLITGETGVGKELVARSLHAESGRTGAFIAVNIAGLDDQMFSDSLFGHSKGAFTGADQVREGLVAKAAGGTLFLDEIGDLPLLSQIKLLRLLQEKEFYPLGLDTPKKSDARVVVATNNDLLAKMKENSFRKDLYYRLSAHQVQIPPLRERLEDLPLLVEHLLGQACEELQKSCPTYPAELPPYLASYDFPGNVRELRAMLFDAVARHRKGVLSLASFRKIIGARGSRAKADPLGFFRDRMDPAAGVSMPTLKDAEDALVAHALTLAKGNQGLAASYLGITRQALNKRLTRKHPRRPSLRQGSK